MINGPWMTTPLSANKKLKWGLRRCPTSAASRPPGRDHTSSCSRASRTPDENKADRQPGVRQLDLPAVAQLGGRRHGAGPQRGPRGSRSSPKKGAVTEFAKELDFIRFVPPIPGVHDLRPEWDTAVSEAMLGKKEIAAALPSGGEKANKILAANQKKYG